MECNYGIVYTGKMWIILTKKQFDNFNFGWPIEPYTNGGSGI